VRGKDLKRQNLFKRSGGKNIERGRKEGKVTGLPTSDPSGWEKKAWGACFYLIAEEGAKTSRDGDGLCPGTKEKIEKQGQNSIHRSRGRVKHQKKTHVEKSQNGKEKSLSISIRAEL